MREDEFYKKFTELIEDFRKAMNENFARTHEEFERIFKLFEK